MQLPSTHASDRLIGVTLNVEQQDECDPYPATTTAEREAAAALFEIADSMLNLASHAYLLTVNTLGTPEFDSSDFFRGATSTVRQVLLFDGSRAKYHLRAAHLEWTVADRGEGSLELASGERALTAARCARRLGDSEGDSAIVAQADTMLSIILPVLTEERRRRPG